MFKFLRNKRLLELVVSRNNVCSKLSTTCALRRIENVIVLGAGLMGSGIAQSCATSGSFASVALYDTSDRQLDIAKVRIKHSVDKLFNRKRVKLNSEQALSNIRFTKKVDPVSRENLLIIEAIPEILDVKQELFRDLCSLFSGCESVIYTTNTSSLSCNEIATYVDCRERFAGLHFFNPVPMMQLVEIIRLINGTDERTHELLAQFVRDIGKVAVTCKDTPGFIVNRLLIPYMQDAVKMVERGDASIKDVDTAMKLGAGYPMGPFELMDYTGLDTNQFVIEALAKRKDFDMEVYESKTIKKLVKEGNLGRKTGKGFYEYNEFY